MKTIEERIRVLGIHLEKYITKDFMEWLIQNGFFTAPASTKYHGAYQGGLFDHSLAVTEALVDITLQMNLQWENPRSPFIIGMFHDLCKIDNYIWDPYGETWDYNPKADRRHGEKSVDLLSKFFELTEEEILCIRWHMGAYDNRENWDPLGQAIEKYPNVLWTHTADMVAARIKGV